MKRQIANQVSIVFLPECHDRKEAKSDNDCCLPRTKWRLCYIDFLLPWLKIKILLPLFFQSRIQFRNTAGTPWTTKTVKIWRGKITDNSANTFSEKCFLGTFQSSNMARKPEWQPRNFHLVHFFFKTVEFLLELREISTHGKSAKMQQQKWRCLPENWKEGVILKFNFREFPLKIF